MLAERYSVDDSGMDAANNSMAVAEFQTFTGFIPSDLSTFSQACGVNVSVDEVIGGSTKPGAVSEATLDIEYVRGVTPDSHQRKRVLPH